METISIQPSGAYFAARYFSVLPLVVLAVAWIVRRMQGETGLGGRVDSAACRSYWCWWPIMR